jgi:hypothetical protein
MLNTEQGEVGDQEGVVGWGRKTRMQVPILLPANRGAEECRLPSIRAMFVRARSNLCAHQAQVESVMQFE